MKLSDRSIRVKELIHEEVGMGTHGLVELELQEFDKRIDELQELLSEYNHVTVSTICSFGAGTIGHNDLARIRRKVANALTTTT